MLLKPYRIILLTFLLVLGIIIFPVCGYELLTTYNCSVHASDYAAMGGVVTHSGDTGDLANVTKIDWVGKMFVYAGSETSGTHAVTWCNNAGTTKYGVGTITWDSPGTTGSYVDGSATYLYNISFGTGETQLIAYEGEDACTGNKFGSTAPHKINLKGDLAGSPAHGLYQFGVSQATAGGNYTYYSGSSVTTPDAAFSCTPTSQFPDEDVVCTDTSTNTPTDWYWTIDAEAVGIDGWMTSTSRNFTWSSHYPGLYSVNLRANNSAGYDWENKSSYVSISENATPDNCNIPPLAGYIRTNFQCTDANSEAAISDCNIQLNDLEGGSWSNATSVDSGVWCIDTLPNHHINGYGDATGYSDGERINVESWNGQTYTILMIPGYIPDATAGNVWVYVHVTKFGTASDLEGVYVSLSGSGETTKSDYTNAAGVVMLQWPNETTAYVNAVKAGYTTGIKVFDTSASGPDFVDIALHADTQTLTIVPTTGPGGTVPTTIGPWGTPGPGGTYAPGYVNNQGQAMMDLLATHGYNLVYLCIMVTMLALLGVKLGGR